MSFKSTNRATSKPRSHASTHDQDVEIVDLSESVTPEKLASNHKDSPSSRTPFESPRTRTTTDPYPTPRKTFTQNWATPSKHADSPSQVTARHHHQQQPLTPPSPTIQKTTTTTGLATPAPTPKKQRAALHEIPELAARFQPQKSATLQGIDYRNPHTFTVKPAYWKRWSSEEYCAFAGELRAQFDPLPFARRSGRSVEEIQHVFTALVVNPLYNSAEASRRGEEGMGEILRCFGEFGTPLRWWGRKGDRERGVLAELEGVGVMGVVVLILSNGDRLRMGREDLSTKDMEYLSNTLSEEDKGVFVGRR